MFSVADPKPIAGYNRPGTSPDATSSPSSRPGRGKHTPAQLESLSHKFAAALKPGGVRGLARELRLPEWSIQGFRGIGFMDEESPPAGCEPGAWTFTERDGCRTIVGFHLRYGDRRGKKHLAGTGRGLFLPAGWSEGESPLFLVEGASDTVAMTAAGLAAVGRPSNVGGIDQLAELLKVVPPTCALIVVGENDRKPWAVDDRTHSLWPGRTGAYETAAHLAAKLSREVSWCLVPGQSKDTRDWLTSHAQGGDSTDLWKRLGQTLAGLMARASTAEGATWPAPPEIAGSVKETGLCPFLYRGRLKGRKGGKQEGKRAVVGFSCNTWQCRSCRVMKAGEALAWFCRCIIQWCDPLRLHDLIPRIDRNDSKGQPPVRYPNDYPYGPWRLYQGLVGDKKWTKLREVIRQKQVLANQPIEYVRVLVDYSSDVLPGFWGDLTITEKTSEMTKSPQKPGKTSDRMFAVLVALPAEVEAFGPLVPVASVDAGLELLGKAIDAIPGGNSVESKPKRLRPVSASRGWTRAEDEEDDPKWEREGSTLMPCDDAAFVTDAMGGGSSGVVSPDAQEQSVWEDGAIGGDFDSWLTSALMDPRLTEGQLPRDAVLQLADGWREFFRRLPFPDGVCFRDAVTRIFSKLPGDSWPDDIAMELLSRAVIDDDASRDVQIALKEGRIGEDVLRWLKERARKLAAAIPE